MFLYAKLVMNNLLGQTRLAHLKRELEPGRFPKNLEQAYVAYCLDLNPMSNALTAQLDTEG